MVQYMKIKEYRNKEECIEGKFVIDVLHDKTSSSSGPAEIVIGKEIDEIIEMYL